MTMATQAARNGRSDNQTLTRSISAAITRLTTAPDSWDIAIKGDVSVQVPKDLELITPYVLLEQEDWFEDEIGFLRHALWEGAKVLDVGANYGVYGLTIARRVGPTGHVWCFEPSKETRSFLAASVSSNGFDNVSITDYGLSDHHGDAHLSNRKNSELNAVLEPGESTKGAESIRLTTLDRFVKDRDFSAIDFIKIDAEGQEARIIEGGLDTLTHMSPLVMFEIKQGSSYNTGLVERFQSLGYGIYRLLPGLNVLAPYESSEALDPYCLNLFACKNDRASELSDRGVLALKYRCRGEDISPERGSFSDFLRDKAYVAGLSQLCPANDGNDSDDDYAIALAYYATSRTVKDSARRVVALEAAYELLKKAVKQSSGLERWMSFAAVCAELGYRKQANQVCTNLLGHLEKRTVNALKEPFLPVARRYEDIPVPAQCNNWIVSSLIEQQNRLHAFSTYFSQARTLPSLNRFSALGFSHPEMLRRMQLIQRRSASTQPLVSDPKLTESSPDNLNPEFWTV